MAQGNEIQPPDLTLVNSRLSLSDINLGDNGSLRLALWGKNLENKAYKESGVDFGALGFTSNVYAELRSYGIDAVYEF